MKTIRGYLLAWLIGGMLLCTFIAGVLLYNVVRAENRQLFNNQLKHIAGSLLIHLPPLTTEPGKPGTDESDAPDDGDRKSTRLNSSHIQKSRMPSSA